MRVHNGIPIDQHEKVRTLTKICWRVSLPFYWRMIVCREWKIGKRNWRYLQKGEVMMMARTTIEYKESRRDWCRGLSSSSAVPIFWSGTVAFNWLALPHYLSYVSAQPSVRWWSWFWGIFMLILQRVSQKIGLIECCWSMVHRLNHQWLATHGPRKRFFGRFLLRLSRIKRPRVTSMVKFSPMALNFGYDFVL